MNKETKIFMVMLGVIGVFLAFYFWNISASNPTQSGSETTNISQKYDPKVDDQADVTVTVTPIQLSEGPDEWKFNVVMDTHSIELDQNMIDVAILIDDQGTRYSPLNWNGTTGGHHREGILAFQKIAPLPKFVEMEIVSVGDVIRRFVWELK